ATAAMYNALRHKIDFEINFIDWPAHNGEKTYADVARRVVDENNIENGDIIGGSSLGGMVALEIGQMIQPKASVLLGSAVNVSEVQSLLAMFSPLVTITPIALVQVLAGKQKSLVSTMFADANADFIRAMCSYLHLWPGYSGQMSTIYRLHGRKDQVIPCPSSGATVIEDAGHLLAMTRADETAAFLQKIKARLSAL
ncbi:MAG TPA: alpha/beta hydrolase, partial [Thermodesulfovibrionales bacterium]|nr:alpha/beta hydrolase [Thermodesulfovibrionales bacterium]